MMRHGEAVFVDTGAWIALAVTTDAHHERAEATWNALEGHGARLHVSVPVLLETFTFLERNASRDLALAWKDSLKEVPGLRVVECTAADVERAWSWFRKPDLFKLSAVDATSFALMARLKIRTAFAFDQHFARAGFRIVG